MSERLRPDVLVVALVLAVIAFHLMLPGLHALNADFWAGFAGGLLTGLVIAWIADVVVLVPAVDWFERRRVDGG